MKKNMKSRVAECRSFGPDMHQKITKSSCTLCIAVAYCCGAVAPRAIAALLGRFLPRLGPLVHSSGPFFCLKLFSNDGVPRTAQARRDVATPRPPGTVRDCPGEQRPARRPG